MRWGSAAGDPCPLDGAGLHGVGRWRIGCLSRLCRHVPRRMHPARRHIDSLESGIPNAITVFEELRARGHNPVGIRLDSGDLAHRSVLPSQMLDKAGFEDVRIVLSSGLDELTIFQILTQITAAAPRYGADPDRVIRRLLYGVGTKMATSDGLQTRRRRQVGRHRRPIRTATGDQGFGHSGQDRESGPQTGPSPLLPVGPPPWT